MKRNFIVIVLLLLSVSVMSQENRITFSGGYVFTNIENADADATGFRINGLYEFVPMGGNLAHGFSVGYIRTQASTTLADYTLTSWPIYYAPKYHIGKDKFRGFIKGALGMHTSGYERTGTLGTLEDRDFGFYGGAGLGLMVNLSEKLFINAEYEWAYLSNSSYSDGFVNSIMGGIGINF